MRVTVLASMYGLRAWTARRLHASASNARAHARLLGPQIAAGSSKDVLRVGPAAACTAAQRCRSPGASAAASIHPLCPLRMLALQQVSRDGEGLPASRQCGSLSVLWAGGNRWRPHNRARPPSQEQFFRAVCQKVAIPVQQCGHMRAGYPSHETRQHACNPNVAGCKWRFWSVH